jgi:hypothetical protein
VKPAPAVEADAAGAAPAVEQKAAEARDMVVTSALPDRAAAGGVVGGVIGGVPQAAPPPPPPPPKQERPAVQEARSIQAFTVVAPSAKSMFLSGLTPQARVMAVRAESAAQAMGLRYSIVRREGEAPIIRFTSNVNGYLSIAGATPVALTAMQPYNSPPVEGDEVKVVFARQPQTTAEAAPEATTEVSAGETYVVNPSGAAFSFTISLRPR